MNKVLCFNINDEDLYLEQVLVDYMDVPIFFICKGNQRYYLVQCIDMEELKYIVVQLPIVDVYNLLHGKLPMRNIILKQDCYWDITSGDEVAFDVVNKYPITDLEQSVLPEENACFMILTKEMEQYVRKIDNELFASDSFYLSETQANLNQLLASGIGSITECLRECHFVNTREARLESYDETMQSIRGFGAVLKKPSVSDLSNEVGNSYMLTEPATPWVTVAA